MVKGSETPEARRRREVSNKKNKKDNKDLYRDARRGLKGCWSR
jgi:hypothetical protein